MRWAWLALWGGLLAWGPSGWAQPDEPAPVQIPRPENNPGEDPTHPVHRLDVRYGYTDRPGSESRIILRYDSVHSLGEEWTWHTRFDLPLALQGGLQLDELLVQNYVIAPLKEDLGVLFGARVTVPTGTPAGHWTVAPALGIVQQLPDISDGSYLGVVVYNRFALAGAGAGNELTVQPLLHFNLGAGYFAQSQPQITHSHASGRWFVPLDLLLGRQIGERVYSLNYRRHLAGENPPYHQQVELRVGFFL